MMKLKAREKLIITVISRLISVVPTVIRELCTMSGLTRRLQPGRSVSDATARKLTDYPADLPKLSEKPDWLQELGIPGANISKGLISWPLAV